VSTEILPSVGGRGDPSIRVTDVVDSRQVAFAEQRRAEREAEIKAAVDDIEHRRFLREHTPPRPPVPTHPVEQLRAEWAREKWLAEVEESRRLPERLAELEAWARKATLEAALDPPPPKPPTRFGKTLSPAQVAHEQALAAAFAAKSSAAKCQCGSFHAGDRCIYGYSG
jgi:hypothetical protein